MNYLIQTDDLIIIKDRLNLDQQPEGGIAMNPTHPIESQFYINF